MDVSGSQRTVLAEQRRASRSFSIRFCAGPQDQAFVVRFDRQVELLPGSDSSGAGCESRAPPRARLSTTRIVFAARRIAGQPGRKALIVLSDGYDTSSSASLGAAIETAQRADALVYSIRFLDRDVFAFEVPASQGGSPVPREGRKALERIAKETGGGYFDLTAAETLEKIYSRIEDELRNQYSLGFTPSRRARRSGLSENSCVGKTKGRDRPGPRRLLSGRMNVLGRSSFAVDSGRRRCLCAWPGPITRAAVQSITIDEANTYMFFVSRHLYLWYAANNHILNSTLMYGFTRMFGLSQFTARLPALLGAAFYISAAYRLCRLLRRIPVRATDGVCVPGVQPVHLRLSGGRARIRSGFGISDVGDGVFRRVAYAGIVPWLRPAPYPPPVRRLVRGRELFFRLRKSGGDGSRFFSAPGAGARTSGSACWPPASCPARLSSRLFPAMPCHIRIPAS